MFPGQDVRITHRPWFESHSGQAQNRHKEMTLGPIPVAGPAYNQAIDGDSTPLIAIDGV